MTGAGTPKSLSRVAGVARIEGSRDP
jgi:hypothetical protein